MELEPGRAEEADTRVPEITRNTSDQAAAGEV